MRTQAASVNLYWLVAGAGCYACNYLTRACRLWLFSRKEVPLFPTTFKITCLHGINTYFFPFRTGELTLPLLYKAYAETGYSLGLRFLVRARLLDFAGLGILVIVSSSLLTSRLPPELKTVFLMLGLGFVMIPYAAVYCLRLDTPMIKKWREKAIGLRLPAYPNFQEITVSLLIWLWIGGTIFCVARSLNLPLSFFDVLFLVTFQLPLQIIPVQGIANAGNHEAAWLGALALLGVKREVIVPLALSSHVVLIGYVLVLGLVASLLPAGNRRRT
ncbi:MAG: hypothetical protein Kow0089_09740 [Desulfobulbaceae bacterium]